MCGLQPGWGHMAVCAFLSPKKTCLQIYWKKNRCLKPVQVPESAAAETLFSHSTNALCYVLGTIIMAVPVLLLATLCQIH